VNASSNPTAILVVEDEAAIRRGLCDALAFRGFAPESSERGDEGLRSALQGRHALIILDLMLPGLSGFDVCRELRAAGSETPVLMLTARGSEEDVLRGFACGADDYVTKPFSVAQLLARVEAILRRAGGSAAAETAPEPFRFGPWEIEAAALRARRGDGQSVELTRRELDLLALFAREEGRIVGRRLLLREIWGYTEPERVETRTVDMHVAKLRRKLDPVDGPSLLETVRGEGYRYGSARP
jgi:two-component system response regulator RegX3